jgi:hypothetical protein
LLLILVLGCASGVAIAGDAPVQSPAMEAQIPFANKGGIGDWRVVDNNTVLIQSKSRQWYKATLFGNCTNLAFAQRLGFEANPNGAFDKFSTIKVGEQRCPLSSLVKTDAPPKKDASKKAAGTAPASTAPSP